MLFANAPTFKAPLLLTAEVQISHPARWDRLEQAPLHLLSQPQIPLLQPTSTSHHPGLQHEPQEHSADTSGATASDGCSCCDTKEGKEQLPREALLWLPGPLSIPHWAWAPTSTPNPPLPHASPPGILWEFPQTQFIPHFLPLRTPGASSYSNPRCPGSDRGQAVFPGPQLGLCSSATTTPTAQGCQAGTVRDNAAMDVRALTCCNDR